MRKGEYLGSGIAEGAVKEVKAKVRTVRFGLERGSAVADADAGGTGGFAEHSLHAA